MAITPRNHIKIRKYENIIQECLEKVLEQNNISKSYYNLKGYGEDKICLEKRDSNWILYYGDHGKKVDVKVYPDMKLAALGLIDDLSEDIYEKRKLSHQFRVTVQHAVMLRRHGNSGYKEKALPVTDTELHLGTKPTFSFPMAHIQSSRPKAPVIIHARTHRMKSASSASSKRKVHRKAGHPTLTNQK